MDMLPKKKNFLRNLEKQKQNLEKKLKSHVRLMDLNLNKCFDCIDSTKNCHYPMPASNSTISQTGLLPTK